MIQATENLRFGDLISRRVPFEVPRYQRSYAWDEEEIKEFLQDITELYEARIANPPNHMSHFFGGIVSVNRQVGGTTHGRIYDIVDGQQRLATFMLTTCAILEGLQIIASDAQAAGDNQNSQAAQSYADTTKGDYLFYREVVDYRTEDRLRLTLSKADKIFFDHLIRDIKSARGRHNFDRDSHRRLQVAWKQIFEKLVREPILENAALSYREKIDRILQLRSAMIEDCYIIHIVSDNHQEAYRLFSILNDRGKTLSDGDLLRSYTLENLEYYPGHQEQVGEAWDKMLGSTDVQIDDFLRTYYPSHQGKRAPRKDLATKYRRTFFDFPRTIEQGHEADADTIRNRVLAMQRESEAFFDIVEGTWPYAIPSVTAWDRGRLHNLIKVLKHTICIPLLLSAYHHLTEQDFADLVNLLERFSFRYITIVGVHAGKLGDLYNKQAKDIRDDGAKYKLSDFQSNLQTLQAANARDATFANALADKLVYQTPAMRKIVRYFLSTLEDYYQWYQQGKRGSPTPDKTHVFDLGTLTIEHIYPQNPTPGAVDPALAPYTHTVGNLSFWSANDNQAASNNPFQAKQPLYQNSSVALNRELANLQDWNINELRSRQDRLITIAQTIFTA